MDTDKHTLTLKLNKPYCTKEPILQLKGLAFPGQYQFQLVVIDNAGNQSRPTTIMLIVNKPETIWQKFNIFYFIKALTKLLRRFLTNLTSDKRT